MRLRRSENTMGNNSIESLLYKLRKGEVLRKHSLHGKIAASVSLKLFISGNERCNTTDVPKSMSGTLLINF